MHGLVSVDDSAREGTLWGTSPGMLIGLRLELGERLKYPQIPEFEPYD